MEAARTRVPRRFIYKFEPECDIKFRASRGTKAYQAGDRSMAVGKRTKEYWWEPQGGLRFSCFECGRCCGGAPGNVWVDGEEQRRIARYLCIDAEELRKKYLVRKQGRVSLKELDNLDCIFYERNSAHCLIYKVRPLQCSLFPFWPSLVEDENIWIFYAKLCPGMNQGKLYTKEMILNIAKTGLNEDL